MSALGLLSFLTWSFASASSNCSDVAPNPKATCAERLKWGGCSASYMYGHCCQTCFNCDPQGVHGCLPAPTPAPMPPPVAHPRRLIVTGKDVASSDAPGIPIQLKGFNFWFQNSGGKNEVTLADRNATKLFPNANFARLVMNHWLDENDGDCYSPDASNGFLTSSCLAMFDGVIEWATGEAKLWVILTARAANAAGDAGAGHTVFTNSTLRSEMIAMWRFLARRYRGINGIAGYEVMSEPRTDNDNNVVHDFQADACKAVWKEDPLAVCFVGPAKFYNRVHLGPEYLIRDGPVIYAANYFVPSFWVTAKTDAAKAVPFGGSAKCSVIGAEKDCELDGPDTVITFDRTWLSKQFTMMDEFQKNYSVPIWVDQWGVHAEVGAGNQQAYLSAVTELLQDRGYHSTYWIYRRERSKCTGNYEICCSNTKDGTQSWNSVAISQLQRYFDKGQVVV